MIPPQRHYPPFYEKIIPIALVAILITVIILLLIIFMVATGLMSS